MNTTLLGRHATAFFHLADRVRFAWDYARHAAYSVWPASDSRSLDRMFGENFQYHVVLLSGPAGSYPPDFVFRLYIKTIQFSSLVGVICCVAGLILGGFSLVFALDLILFLCCWLIPWKLGVFLIEWILTGLRVLIIQLGMKVWPAHFFVLSREGWRMSRILSGVREIPLLRPGDFAISNDTRNPFNLLPDEIVTEISRHLPFADALCFANVSRRMRALTHPYFAYSPMKKRDISQGNFQALLLYLKAYRESNVVLKPRTFAIPLDISIPNGKMNEIRVLIFLVSRICKKVLFDVHKTALPMVQKKLFYFYMACIARGTRVEFRTGDSQMSDWFPYCKRALPESCSITLRVNRSFFRTLVGYNKKIPGPFRLKVEGPLTGEQKTQFLQRLQKFSANMPLLQGKPKFLSGVKVGKS
ncbi:MAG: hypothetical protein A3F09_06070 [Chlamydiae bacterium RIFCSPHIGHO2_12_FULL_49_11]|nr:MAG: hypothetical protein A3F09_06070 [Chlamydiae bacterium RIFCSPHIGHO2_12_FULL_49_11]